MLVLWIALAGLAGGVAVLAMPLDLVFSIRRYDGQVGARVHLIWAFGLVRLRLGWPRAKKSGRKREKPKGDEKEAGGRVGAILRNRGLIRRMLGLLRDLLGCIHVRMLRLSVRLGLDDPADTGRLWGAISPLLALSAMVPVAQIHVAPIFSGAILEMDAKGDVRVVPLELLWVVIGFLVSGPVLRTLITARRRA